MTENKYTLGIFSLLVLLSIYIYARNSGAEKQPQHRILLRLLYISAAIIVLDMADWLLNGVAGTFAAYAHYAVISGYFILAFLPPAYWMLFCRYELGSRHSNIARLRNILFGLNLSIIPLLTLVNIKTQWFFFFDAQNRYHRGPYLIIIYVLHLLPIMLNIMYLITHRKKLENRRLLKLCMAIVPPLVGSMIQVLYPKLSLAASMLCFSVLVLFLGMQQRASSTDYLTGLYNRRQLDEYIAMRIKSSQPGKSFSAMLIDMNNFKIINDTLGHNAGDTAIRDMAHILHSNTKINDFIARHGGDEFFAVMDISDYAQLECVVKRIRKSCEEFNLHGGRPFQLDFAIGFDVYRPLSNMSATQFFGHIDTLMYQDKERMQQH